MLIEKGIEASLIPHGTTDQPAEQIVEILRDHEEVLEGLFDFIAQRRELSTSYIKQLHQVLTRHQETVDAVNGLGRKAKVALLHGEWKNLPNNPTNIRNAEVHEYCPPEHVASEMDRLVTLHAEHLSKGVPPEVEAAWLHHRFTQIHPFQDGNGRVARALASIVFIREGWFPLIINSELQRNEYLDALEEADRGDIRMLIHLFSKVQKRAFLKALSLSENVLQDSPLQRVIAAAAERLKARKLLDVEQMQLKSFEISRHLEVIAKTELDSISSNLNKELRTLDYNYFAVAQASNEANDFWFKKQIVQTAQELDYYADTRTYSSWVRLKIKEDRQTELVISFHALGVEFFGIMAVSAFIEYRDKNEEAEISVDGPYVLSKDVFQFSYRESEQEVIERFNVWLKDVLLVGLDMWRRQL